ncbi:MAG: SDR family NAD(P)-dependent oxidoreductase [Acidiferrobacterales bacterium]|nr:SDR family NAD(P)-dependent oxidoreductase [Acidiferrobacterales bacterium]
MWLMDKGQYSYTDSVAVVTGASRGIGRETAWALARKGSKVILIARPSIELEEVHSQLLNAEYLVESFPCDLSKDAELDALVNQLIQRFPRIDILVNCAGVGKFGPLDSLTLDEVRDPLKVPFQAAVVLSRGVLPMMKGNHRGRIINLIGPAAYFDLPWMASYTASRSGMLSFTRALDDEVAADGVRVKTVCPAWVDTEYIRRNQTDGNWLPKVSQYFPTSSAAQAAEFVLDAIASNKREIKPSWLLRFCAFNYRCFPRTSVSVFKLLGLYQPTANRAGNKNLEGGSRWTNWEESISLNAGKAVLPSSVEEICRIVKDSDQYPSPIRPAGSRHSTTHCGVADGGTLVITRKMDRVVEIDRDNLTVTVEAGALYIDVARKLREHGLQFYVNVEIGNLTMGSAASTGTKDASMPGEFGQVCSYCIAVKMVNASGNLQRIDESQPQLLQKVRSSYGLFGVIVETTFQIRPMRAMKVFHKTYRVEEFEKALPTLKEKGDSIMYYLFPFQNKLTVEFRRYAESNIPATNRWVWPVRNLFWKTIAPAWGNAISQWVGNNQLKYALIDGFYAVVRRAVCLLLRNEKTIATDQIIRYPEQKGFTKYTFSIWAFPEDSIASTLKAYYAFCQEYYEGYGFRCNMLNVGYRIRKDTNPFFSYSWEGTVMTLDPVHTGGPGWDDFLHAYNQFCSDHHGVPLFNQSKWLTQNQVEKAFGSRVSDFWQVRSELDPKGRFLNQYFSNLLSGKS